jgi:hypothetical protein
MPSPFPGMNPYLEHSDRWSTVHNRFIVAIADTLTPLLLPRYQVDIEKRIYQITDGTIQMVGRSDVSVQSPVPPFPPQPDTSGAIATLQPVRVVLPIEEEVREAYLEIKEVATGRVITTIEILSPTNKKGQGRQKYEKKRQQVLNSRTHLVEIDLLRAGEALPMHSQTSTSDYHVLVSRAYDRPNADLYPFNLQELMPSIPIPLQLNEQEPVLPLKLLLEDLYERSGYAYFINYRLDPIPALTSDNQAWLDQLLRPAGLR